MKHVDTSDGLTSNRHALGVSTFQRARVIVKQILVSALARRALAWLSRRTRATVLRNNKKAL